MAVTVGTIAGSTGLGTERQAVRLGNGDLWAFGYTGTNVLSTWVSQDNGASWTAGATRTLTHAHNSEGRNLAVAYENVGGVDVVQVGLIWKSGSSLGASNIRATIASGVLTFHGSETTVAAATADAASLFWASSGLDFDSTNKLHFANGYSGGGNGDVNSSDSTADPGTSETGATPVTWTSHVVDSNGVLTETRSAYIVDTGSGTVGLLSDNGSGASTTDGIDWFTWNGTAWGAGNDNNRFATGTITAIPKSDWAAVQVSTSDVHVVYRDSGGVLHHRRWNGTAWSDGQAIPDQASASGAGITMCSDGASVWLLVIDTDAASTVRVAMWSDLAHNEVADRWDAWQVVEDSSATRSGLGCVKNVLMGTGLAYWTEGTSLVAATFSASSPPDPAFYTWVQSAQGSSGASASTFAVTFTTQNVVVGNRILVAVSEWNAVATTVTSVTDSAGNTYAKDNDGVLSDGTHVSHWSAPITAGGGTKPTVTLHASAATSEWAMHIDEYAGLSTASSGYLDGTNKNLMAVSTSPITSGASSPVPTAANELAFGSYGDGGNTIVTIGVSAGWTQRGTSIQNTGTTAELAVADQATQLGVGSNASFTLSSTGSPGGALVTVYKLAPGTTSGRVAPVVQKPLNTTWSRRQAWAYLQRFKVAPAPAAGNVALTRTADDALTGISDSALRALSLARTGGDAPSVSDIATRALGLSRPISDALAGISDSALRAALNFVRSGSDAPVLSDSTVRTVSLGRTAADSEAAITDAAVGQKGVLRTASDSLTAISESATRSALSFVRSAADAPSLVDSAARSALNFVRSAADATTSISDAAVGARLIIRTAADSLTAISDSAARSALHFVRSAADATTLSEAASRALAFVRSASDAPVISDVAVGAKLIVRTASDSLTAISDSAVRNALNLVRSATDATSLVDSVARAPLNFIRAAGDAPAIAEVAAAGRAIVRTASDAITAISEQAVAQVGHALVRTASDAISPISDSAVRAALHFARSAGDAAVITESVAAVRHFVRSAGDLLGVIADVASRGGLGPFRRYLEANLPRSVLDNFLRRPNVDSSTPDDDVDNKIQGG